jgi:DNA-binding response OmpR family regulator
MRVLIVDDCHRVREILACILGAFDIDAIEADGGGTALSSARQLHAGRHHDGYQYARHGRSVLH